MSHLDVISTTFIRLAQSLAGCINVFTDYNQTWTITRIGPVYSRYEKDYVLTWQGAQQRNVLDARLDIVSDRLLLFFDIAPFFPFLTRSTRALLLIFSHSFSILIAPTAQLSRAYPPRWSFWSTWFRSPSTLVSYFCPILRYLDIRLFSRNLIVLKNKNRV